MNFTSSFYQHQRPYNGESSRTGASQPFLMDPTMGDFFPSDQEQAWGNGSATFGSNGGPSQEPGNPLSIHLTATHIGSNPLPLQLDTHSSLLQSLRAQGYGTNSDQEHATHFPMAQAGVQSGFTQGLAPEQIGGHSQSIDDSVETFFHTPLGQMMLHAEDASKLFNTLPDGSKLFDKPERIRRDMDYEHFRATTQVDFQGLGGGVSSPRFVPPGYRSFPFAFPRTPYSLKEFGPITIDNLVQGLESYCSRCDDWVNDFASFIKLVGKLAEFAEIPQPTGQVYASFGQNLSFFYFEVIAPDTDDISRKVAEIAVQESSSRTSGAGEVIDLSNEWRHLNELAGPRTPQHLVPHGPQNFDEAGLELLQGLPEMEPAATTLQSPTPVTETPGPSSSHAGAALRRSSHVSRGMRRAADMTTSSPAARNRSTPRRRPTPVTPRTQNPSPQPSSSEPPSTISRPSRKRARTIKQEPSTPAPLRRLSPRIHIKSEAANPERSGSLVSPPMTGVGLGIQLDTTITSTPVYNRAAHPRYGGTYPTNYTPYVPVRSPGGFSDTTVTLSEDDDY